MRFHRFPVFCLALATLACAAQRSGGIDDDLMPMGRPLIVWVIKSSTVPPPRYASYQEQTTGGFGTTASSTGRAASDVGTPAGNFGHAASDVGQTSSTYGQTAGTFGKVSSDAGQTSSTYGRSLSQISSVPPSQTASSYGHPPANVGSSMTASSSTRSVSYQPTWEQAMRAAASASGAPNLGRVAFVDVNPSELRKRLESATIMEFPNILVGNPLPPEWFFGGLEGRYGTTVLGSLGIWEPVERSFLDPDAGVQIAVLTRAPYTDESRALAVRLRDRRIPDSEAARRFLAWAQDSRGPVQQPLSRNQSLSDKALDVAKSTADSVLMGGDAGGAGDDELAKFSGGDAMHKAFLPPAGMNLAGARIRTDVVQAYGNDRLAVVAMRSILSSPTAFGIVHPLAVLRRAPDGAWKVLQFSPNLAPQLLLHTVDVLRPYTTAVKPQFVADVGGIAQAAPIEGDNRTKFPELWWDNAGGDELLIVEWQQRDLYADWEPSHMDLIPDNDHRLKVRVPATFASEVATYRWRVWSVGLGGATKISEWRTLNIIA